MGNSPRRPAERTVFEEGTALAVNDPLEHLVACHELIEEQLRKLETATRRLAGEAAADRQDARHTLDEILSRLETLGTLHTADEEQTLFPRLRAASSEDLFGLVELAQVLESQHREKEAAFAALAAEVKGLPAAEQAPSAKQLSRLDGLVERLTGLYRPHIMIENERLIPMSKECLKPSELEAMKQEMKARRER